MKILGACLINAVINSLHFLDIYWVEQKVLVGFSVQKNPNELFGQPNNNNTLSCFAYACLFTRISFIIMDMSLSKL